MYSKLILFLISNKLLSLYEGVIIVNLFVFLNIGSSPPFISINNLSLFQPVEFLLL